jgi:hypothetical protein
MKPESRQGRHMPPAEAGSSPTKDRLPRISLRSILGYHDTPFGLCFLPAQS